MFSGSVFLSDAAGSKVLKTVGNELHGLCSSFRGTALLELRYEFEDCRTDELFRRVSDPPSYLCCQDHQLPDAAAPGIGLSGPEIHFTPQYTVDDSSPVKQMNEGERALPNIQSSSQAVKINDRIRGASLT